MIFVTLSLKPEGHFLNKGFSEVRPIDTRTETRALRKTFLPLSDLDQVFITTGITHHRLAQPCPCWEVLCRLRSEVPQLSKSFNVSTRLTSRGLILLDEISATRRRGFTRYTEAYDRACRCFTFKKERWKAIRLKRVSLGRGGRFEERKKWDEILPNLRFLWKSGPE